MSFQIVYVSGGVLDKVKRLEGGRLDAPYMPTLTEPFIKGQMLDIPGSVASIEKSFSTDSATELLCISVGASKYSPRDNWDLYIGQQKIVESNFTKNLPEGAYLMAAKPVSAETPIKFVFHNESGIAKSVWVNYQFLR